MRLLARNTESVRIFGVRVFMILWVALFSTSFLPLGTKTTQTFIVQFAFNQIFNDNVNVLDTLKMALKGFFNTLNEQAL